MQLVRQHSDVRRTIVGLTRWSAIVVTGLLAGAGTLFAEGVILKNNFYIEGRPFEVQAVSTSVAPNAGEVINRPVMMIDAGMRRYYVPVQNVANVLNNNGLGAPELFDLRLPRRPVGRVVASIGPLHNVTPFDPDGRREITLNTTRGPEVIEQGIF